MQKFSKHWPKVAEIGVALSSSGRRLHSLVTTRCEFAVPTPKRLDESLESFRHFFSLSPPPFLWHSGDKRKMRGARAKEVRGCWRLLEEPPAAILTPAFAFLSIHAHGGGDRGREGGAEAGRRGKRLPVTFFLL